MLYKILGTTTDVETCEHCGKTHLKKTVVLETENGDVVYFGVDCAARALGQKNKRIELYAKIAEIAKEYYAKGVPINKLSCYFWMYNITTKVINGHLYIVGKQINNKVVMLI